MISTLKYIFVLGCYFFNRNRLQVLERKLVSLETFNNIYKALDQMRSSSIVADTETNEEMRQRVTEECKWFVRSRNNFYLSVKNDSALTFGFSHVG